MKSKKQTKELNESIRLTGNPDDIEAIELGINRVRKIDSVIKEKKPTLKGRYGKNKADDMISKVKEKFIGKSK
tara:strand:+ start:1341 stop:1559 length:219 start_codon:yes stop_codon:yes gene_type:complete